MYDPRTGRWLAQDPAVFVPGDANLYRYAGNDPVNATDPSGLQKEEPEITDKVLKLSNADKEKLFDDILQSGRVLKPAEVAILLQVVQRQIDRGLFFTKGQRLIQSYQSVQAVETLGKQLTIESQSHNRALLGMLTGPLPMLALEATIKKLIRDLDDDSFEVRERASAFLRRLAPVAVDYLRKPGTPEQNWRQKEALNPYIEKLQPSYYTSAFQQVLGRLKAEDQKKVLDSILDPDESGFYAAQMRDWAKEVKKRMEKKDK
jgi:hypothetical protein